MRARLLVLAIAGASLPVAAFGEPVKLPVHKAEQPAGKSEPVVVAESDAAATPALAERSTPAPKPRRARVTSCRCGGQNPSE